MLSSQIRQTTFMGCVRRHFSTRLFYFSVLLGSGFALAEACKVSGLSKWVGTQLAYLDAIPSFAIVIIVCVMITTFTEVSSNTATATIFLPILASLGEEINIHPWYLMLPAAISCSFAFMLPVATPPNAIIFAGGHLKVKDIAKAGIVMNVLAVTVLIICVNSGGVLMFDLQTVSLAAIHYVHYRSQRCITTPSKPKVELKYKYHYKNA